MKINEVIREKRKALSLTQEQVADRLGVSTPAVSKWETGRRLSRYCHFAGIGAFAENRPEHAAVLQRRFDGQGDRKFC